MPLINLGDAGRVDGLPLENLVMAKTTTSKSRAGNRGRAAGAKSTAKSKPARQSRDTRSRSRANDERKASTPKPNLKARSADKRSTAKAGKTKNKRARAASLAAERDGR